MKIGKLNPFKTVENYNLELLFFFGSMQNPFKKIRANFIHSIEHKVKDKIFFPRKVLNHKPKIKVTLCAL